MKKFKTSIISAFFIMLIMIVSASMVDAKPGGFGGRSSSSGSSSYSSPSKSYSSPSKSYSSPSRSYSSPDAQPSQQRKPTGLAFGGRSAAVVGTAGVVAASGNQSKPQPIKIQRDQVLSSIGKKGATGEAAGVLYKDFQTKSKPVAPTAVLSRTEANRIFSPQYRTERRSTYYQGYTPVRYSHMPTTSNYGIWDYMMFAALLDNVGDRQMYYNHQNDPGFQQWRVDANNACAQGDKDVCEKLADLDREMAEYKNKGVPVNPNYITPGIDPSIYTAQNIDTSGLAPIKICAGSFASDYSRFTGQITTLAKVKTVTEASNGSADNLAKLANGQCDAAFVQDDLVQTSNLTKLMTLNQLEVVGLACTTPYEKLQDMPKGTTIFIGSDQTGSQFTFNQLLPKVPHLANMKVDTSKTSLQAVGDVAANGGCIFGVATPESPLFTTLDKTAKFKLVPIMSTDFVDGKPTYKMVIVMDSHYKTLTQDKFTGSMSRGGTDTLAVKTSLVAPQAWIDGNKTTFDVLMLNREALQESVQ